MTSEMKSLARPKVLNHLIKAVIFGWAAYQLALPLRDPAISQIAAVLWGSAAWLCLAGLLRNLHALIVFPMLQASPEALRLRYWKPSRIFNWKMLLPFNWVVDRKILWSNFRGCRTSIISGGDPWDAWQRLLVESDREFHEIGWDVFAGSVTQQMDAINDYREELLRGPSDGKKVAEFQRLRFAQALRIQQPVKRGDWSDFGCFLVLSPLLLVMAGAAGVMVTMFGSLALSFVCRSIGMEGFSELLNQGMNEVATPLGKMPLLVLIGAIGGILVMVVWFTWSMSKESALRVLEFRSEGLAFGKSPRALTLIPWEDVLYAGAMRETTYRRQGAGFSSNHLEVRCRDRSSLVVNGDFPRSLSDLQELIDPPTDKLATAQQLLRQGTPLDQAVAAAGLPPN